MQLNRDNLEAIKTFQLQEAASSPAPLHDRVPGERPVVPLPLLMDLPERVLQFGTGVLLRGLPDYLIDEANRAGRFNGRIVLVKSTSQGDTTAFDRQDGMYTLCIRGVAKGTAVTENKIVSVISRVISAASDWPAVLELAGSRNLQLVISNTTEVGLTLEEEDIFNGPPRSFPAKLLAFLHERYRLFNGTADAGLIIIPTELIPENADRLLEILQRLCEYNGLHPAFREWLTGCNHFCNSLVDCIVPGRMAPEREQELQLALGYRDELMIMSEAYRLWAIETGDEAVKKVLSFADPAKGMVLAPDINRYRTLKLRLLNGAHTFSCASALLAGFPTVREAMQNAEFAGFIARLMREEIVPAITSAEISSSEALRFADEVLDRFRNPFLDHQWASIALQYTSKMQLRNLPLILSYQERTGAPPMLMARGFAAWLRLMYLSDTLSFRLQDHHGPLFRAWATQGEDAYVTLALGATELWGTDLNRFTGFTDAVRASFHSTHSVTASNAGS